MSTSTMVSPPIADPAYAAAADQINRGLFDFVANAVSSFVPPVVGAFLGGGRDVGQPGYGQSGYGQPAYGQPTYTRDLGSREVEAQRGLLDAVGVALPALVDAFPKVLAAWQQGSRGAMPPPNPADLTRGWTSALMKLAPHVINGAASVLSSWVGSRDIRPGDLDAQAKFMGEYTRAVLPGLMAALPSALDDFAPGSRAVGEERNERFLGALLALAPVAIDVGMKIGKKLFG